MPRHHRRKGGARPWSHHRRRLLTKQPPGPPETGVLIDGTADGTFVWALEQPSSPDALDQLRGGFRVQDLSNDGFGYVQNGWEWLLEYQPDGTWDFSWYSVTSGTPAAAIQTATDIGTVTNVQVTLSGNSLSVETSANDGGSYTARGSTTSATYQTQTGLSASYTGATGAANPNGDFSAWTGDDPDEWTVLGESGSDYVTETVNGARFVANGSGDPYIYQTTTADTLYVVEVTCSAFVSGRWAVKTFDGNTILLDLIKTQAGSFAQRYLLASPDTGFYIEPRLGGAHDWTISLFRWRAVGVLDTSGDGGFSEVIQS